jgi:hypothetical protein
MKTDKNKKPIYPKPEQPPPPPSIKKKKTTRVYGRNRELLYVIVEELE